MPNLLLSWCHMLVSCAACILLFIFNGQLLWQGLEMYSAARCVSQRWTSGLCWAAEQEAGAATEMLSMG